MNYIQSIDLNKNEKEVPDPGANQNHDLSHGVSYGGLGAIARPDSLIQQSASPMKPTKGIDAPLRSISPQ